MSRDVDPDNKPPQFKSGLFGRPQYLTSLFGLNPIVTVTPELRKVLTDGGTVEFLNGAAQDLEELVSGFQIFEFSQALILRLDTAKMLHEKYSIFEIGVSFKKKYLVANFLILSDEFEEDVLKPKILVLEVYAFPTKEGGELSNATLSKLENYTDTGILASIKELVKFGIKALVGGN